MPCNWTVQAKPAALRGDVAEEKILQRLVVFVTRRAVAGGHAAAYTRAASSSPSDRRRQTTEDSRPRTSQQPHRPPSGARVVAVTTWRRYSGQGLRGARPESRILGDISHGVCLPAGKNAPRSGVFSVGGCYRAERAGNPRRAPRRKRGFCRPGPIATLIRGQHSADVRLVEQPLGIVPAFSRPYSLSRRVEEALGRMHRAAPWHEIPRGATMRPSSSGLSGRHATGSVSGSRRSTGSASYSRSAFSFGGGRTGCA